MYIQTITSRARKVLSLFTVTCTIFYHLMFSSAFTYHLWDHTYLVVWSPYLKKNTLQLENEFGLHMAIKLWTYPYHYVLYRSKLSSLENYRTIAHLCTLYKLFHRLVYAECIVSLRQNRTNLFYYFFIPFVLSLWKTLDLCIVFSSSLKVVSNVLWYCMHRNLCTVYFCV